MLAQLSRAINDGMSAAVRELDDEELIRCYPELGKIAVEIIVKRHSTKLLGRAERSLAGKGDAEGAVQNTFEKLLRELRQGNYQFKNLLGWLHTTLRNEATMQLRYETRRRRREAEVARPVEDSPQVVEEICHREESELLLEEVSRLSEWEQQFVVSRYKDEMTNREMAETYRLDERAVRYRMNQILDKLQCRLRSRGVALTISGLTATLAEASLKEQLHFPTTGGLGGLPSLWSTLPRWTVCLICVCTAVITAGTIWAIGSFEPDKPPSPPGKKTPPVAKKRNGIKQLELTPWKTYTNSAEIPVVYIPPGQETWLKGGEGFPGLKSMTFGGFYAGKYEVTHTQWRNLMGDEVVPYFSRSGPGRARIKDYSDDEIAQLPMESVTLKEVEALLKILNANHSVLNGQRVKWRLPTTSEWEALSRGAVSQDQSSFSFNFGVGKDLTARRTNTLTRKLANYDDGSATADRPRPVGEYDPSPTGCHDMVGNVYEMTSTRAGDLYVIRGGGYGSAESSCQTKASSRWNGNDRNPKIGVRLIAEPVE